MERKRGLRLFPKTFINLLALMSCMIVLAFFMIYLLMPKFYHTFKQNEIRGHMDEMISVLENNTSDELQDRLMSYAQIYSLGIIAIDDRGNTLFSADIGMTVKYINDIDTGMDGGSQTVDVNILDETRCFATADGKVIKLTAKASLQPINDAVMVILKVLPYALLICIVLAAIASYFYARAITKPIKSISEQTVKMRMLDPKAYCESKNKDEIGALADNVNTLYKQLLGAISDLQIEIKNTARTEQDKLDFLLMASHELKTPLTAVTGIMEGMIHNVGIYKDRNTWLIECKKRIDEMSDLLHEILDTSKLDLPEGNRDVIDTDMGELIENIARPYGIIALSKHIELSVNTTNSFIASISKGLLSKAISNIISNAVNYTDEGKPVAIYFSGKSIVIENSCTPLSNIEMSKIFMPFYRPDFSRSRETGGNGLGLYITDRILKVCDLRYQFLPFENGMRFVIWF